jgi:chemotaxis response regulator CheB
MQRIRVISIDDHPLIHEAIKSLLADYEHIELVGGGMWAIISSRLWKNTGRTW